ncbi:RyR domain-containing protein [Nocardioides exalbidus]|uniref:RyR domain-containing protein n=1 Tax=Nocardioides exalbidus TaxID=402596 RepID=A0A1H4KZE5_9ACTN|nr:RyR domain-containing protein [Nocardioides exalbidus]SEB63478.1 RyR domain-containing protein [Nocardioides exalbidus]
MSEVDADRRILRASSIGALVLTGLSLFLGYVGYRTLGLTPLDSFFGTLQMFALDAPRDLASDSVAIGIARFTAPLALAMASVLAVAALAGTSVRHSWRLRRVDQHVVVLGLSDNSVEFVNSLLEHGQAVVVVELAGDHPRLNAVRQSGALVIVGDASREPAQQRARIERSRRVVVSTGDDGRNLRTAELAMRLMTDSRDATVHVLLNDYWLHEELARTEFTAGAETGPAIDFVHRADYEAAAFIETVTTSSASSLASAVLQFTGTGVRGRRTLVHLARRNLLLGIVGAISVDDATRESVVRPALEEAPWIGDALSSNNTRTRTPGVCLVAVDGSDGNALGTALRLASAHPTSEVFVLTDLPVGESLAQRGSAVRVVPAGSLALSPGSLLSHSWVDTLARSRHQIYCAFEVQRGVDPATNPSIVPWLDLPEPLKESNRDFARSIATLVEGLPLTLTALRGMPEGGAALNDDQLELLARGEHDRWMRDLVRKGWRWGAGPKDSEAKTHPLLVDWADLSEPEREKDRDSIRSIPDMLALVGLELQPER